MAAWTPSKAPRSEHQDLAAAALLGRGAEHPHREPDVVRHRGEGQTRTDSGGRNDVVPAGMTDGGQRVVFGAEGHHELALAGA